MAKRITLTNQGISLLASSSEATGQYYWLGYYALAYVPNLWKSQTVDIPENGCGRVNDDSLGSISITSDDSDLVTPNMTRLTKYGDMIYNIWQGDLNGTGYLKNTSDGSAGGDLFGLAMYNANIKKHYRYVLDENGNNTLVTWVEDSSYDDGTMLGKFVYKGTDGYNSSTLPIPAPLYYLGDVTGKVSVDSFFNSFPTFEETQGSNGNGADVYPTITIKLIGDIDLDIPRVSTDFRGYNDSQGNPSIWNYNGSPSTPYVTPGLFFNTLEIPYPVDPINGFDETSWFTADQTFNVKGATSTDEIFCEEFWKLHTISNYNRFHSSVNSIGHVLNSDLSNRNMAKVTKFFPISNYKVINTETGFNQNSEFVEVTTGIKLSIDIDITPKTLAQGFNTDSELNEENNIEFFEKYNNPLNPDDVKDSFGKSIYNSTHTSFKFNRVGIYAVPLRKAPYVKDQGFTYGTSGENIELEFQINPDEEPVLYAVVDWDNTIVMSDTGDGLNQYRIELDVNLQSPYGVNDTALVRDATIYYNMYEDDALRWYQNQLIANASTQNAITEIGLEVAHLKEKAGIPSCCPTPDLSNKYAPLNHSHDFLRNLRDANLKTDNGLKGIITTAEGELVDGQIYKLGFASVVLGDNNAILSNYSFIGNGQNNYISNNSHISAILTAVNSYIRDDANNSIILGGIDNVINGTTVLSLIGQNTGNTITNSYGTSILSATLSTLTNTLNSTILAGASNEIKLNVSSEPFVRNSVIIAGVSNIIDDSDRAFIGVGEDNYIYYESHSSSILSGDDNILENSLYSSIISGTLNSILNSFVSMIGAGSGNTIQSAFSIIGAGDTNNIEDSTYAIIGAGYNNKILDTSQASGILSGNGNQITEASFSIIGSGHGNKIERINTSSTHNAILGGNGNIINDSNFSIIGGGQDNKIRGDELTSAVFSAILGGGYNLIEGNFNAIVGGSNNYIAIQTSELNFIGGGINNIIGLESSPYTTEDALYNSILGGEFNSIFGSTKNATILGGSYTNVHIDGEVAHSSGAFKNGTEIEAYTKHSNIMLRGKTTDSQKIVTLSLDNEGKPIKLRRGEGFAGTLTVMGYIRNAYVGGCTDDDNRSVDTIYHEIHSISGVFTKKATDSSYATTPVTELTYNEYDRSRIDKPELLKSEYDTMGFSLSGTVGSTTATVTKVDHSIKTGDLIKVTDASDSVYNITGVEVIRINSNQFIYQTTGNITETEPTGADISVTRIIGNSVDHLPSVVDTVLDYRYTNEPLFNEYGYANETPIQKGYPIITLSSNIDGELSLNINASELYVDYQVGSGSNYISIVDKTENDAVFWTASLDLTWITV